METRDGETISLKRKKSPAEHFNGSTHKSTQTHPGLALSRTRGPLCWVAL